MSIMGQSHNYMSQLHGLNINTKKEDMKINQSGIVLGSIMLC